MSSLAEKLRLRKEAEEAASKAVSASLSIQPKAEALRKLEGKIKAAYALQLLHEGEEVKAIDLVDSSLYPSGYIPVDAILEKQSLIHEVREKQKAERLASIVPSKESVNKVKSLMERLATAQQKKEKDHVPHAEEIREINHKAEEANETLAKAINADSIPAESPANSTQSRSEILPPVEVQKESPAPEASSREIIKTFVEAETKKMSLAERLAMKKASQEAAALNYDPPAELGSEFQETETVKTVIYNEEILNQPQTEEIASEIEEYKGAFSLNIKLNEKQLLAKEMALSGKTFCLIGPAGSGKTTAQRSVAESLLQDKRLGTTQFKLAGTQQRVQAPSIAFVAYTRRASANLQRAIHKNPELEEALKHNVMTIHALLEFEPVIFWDEEKEKESMRFEPKRHAGNPLSITNLVIEEASMLGLDLWQQLWDALPEGVQIIFIGDINQLPPVFGASILNYALVQTPVVELTEVYRQKGDSLVLANAHHILKGEKIEEGEGFTVVRGKNDMQVGQEKMSISLGAMFKKYDEIGFYDPEQDMILSPFNKHSLGTDNMNKWISQFIGEKKNSVVFEVIAGFNKLYLAEGDKVMYNKQDAIITKIMRNPQYHGKEPQMPGHDLSRFGVRLLKDGAQKETDLDDLILNYENFSIEELAETEGERKMQCSHVVTIQTEVGQTRDLAAAGDFAPQVFSLGYVLTVHKAQGCEWRKVFIILHKDHSVMLSRELFYTAVTRAREECIVIAKDFIIEKAIKNQRIKGNSLADKIEYFNSGALDVGSVMCTK